MKYASLSFLVISLLWMLMYFAHHDKVDLVVANIYAAATVLLVEIKNKGATK